MTRRVHTLAATLGVAIGVGAGLACTDPPDSDSEAETTAPDSETDTGDGDGDGDAVCMGDEDCPDAAAPFCDLGSGECVDCDGTADPDGACAGADPALPLCLMGTCVACTDNDTSVCVDTTPICDLDTNTCVGCSDHAQCPDSACNLAAGNCIDPANILHVDGDAQTCPGGDGTEAMPYCTLLAAFVAAPAEALIIVHELTGNDPYIEDIALMGTAAVFGAPGEDPRWQGSNNAPALTVGGSGILFMRDIMIAGTQNGGEGLVVAGGSAWVEQAKIINNSGGGIVVDNGGTLALENSFVGGSSSSPSLDVIDGSCEINFSTLALPPSLGGPSLACTDGASTTVRNSIIVSSHGDPEVDCPNVSITSSALEMALGNNLSLGDVDVNWFEDYLGGDFHLAPGMYPPTIETAATWTPGDPPTDIDDDPRPTEEGPDFAGADRIP